MGGSQQNLCGKGRRARSGTNDFVSLLHFGDLRGQSRNMNIIPLDNFVSPS